MRLKLLKVNNSRGIHRTVTLNFTCAINSHTLLPVSVCLVLVEEMELVAKKNHGSPNEKCKVFKVTSLDLQICSLPRHHIAKLPYPFNLKLLPSQDHPVDWFAIHCWISLSNRVVSMVLFTCKGYDLVASLFCWAILLWQLEDWTGTSFLPTCALWLQQLFTASVSLRIQAIAAKGRKVFRAEGPGWRC